MSRRHFLIFKNLDINQDDDQQPSAIFRTVGSSSQLLFCQLFEKKSSTYTYLLTDVSHPDKPAPLIELVDKTVDRDVSLVKDLGLKLIYAMSTHVHADHETGTGLIKVPTFEHAGF